MASISRLEDLERNLAFSVLNRYDASSRPLMELASESSPLSDQEKLVRLRAFIEEHGCDSKQKVDFKDPRIQELFDRAVLNALYHDCTRALRAQQDHLEEKKGREHFLTLSHQEEARKNATQTGVFNQLRKGVESVWSWASQNSNVEPPKVYQVQTEEDLILIESEEAREMRMLSLLERWEADPFTLPIDSEVQKRIAELRNNLLVKGKEMVIPREEIRLMPQLRRIS